MASVPPLEFAGIDAVLEAWQKEDAELERRERDRQLLHTTRVISIRDRQQHEEVEDMFEEMAELGALTGEGLSIRRPK